MKETVKGKVAGMKMVGLIVVPVPVVILALAVVPALVVVLALTVVPALVVVPALAVVSALAVAPALAVSCTGPSRCIDPCSGAMPALQVVAALPIVAKLAFFIVSFYMNYHGVPHEISSMRCLTVYLPVCQSG